MTKTHTTRPRKESPAALQAWYTQAAADCERIIASETSPFVLKGMREYLRLINLHIAEYQQEAGARA